MNSKSKIWQIVLLVLLVLAIAAILLFNNKLNASKESLSSTIAQLNEEQANSAALQADLDAAKVDYEDVSSQLQQAREQGIERNLFPNLADDERLLVSILDTEGDLQLNQLSVKANTPIGRLTALLFQLEMKGVVKPMAGGNYHLLK